MSNNAYRYRVRKHTCPCGRPALYLSRVLGRFRARKDHDLCLRCYRSLLSSNVARALEPARRHGFA